MPSVCGTSTSTMSPSSLLAAQTAAVAPTFPAPIMLIFGRRITSFRVDEGVDYGETLDALQSRLSAQICLLYIRMLEQIGCLIGEDHAAALEHIAAMGDAQCHVGVLLHQKNRRSLGVDILDDLK